MNLKNKIKCYRLCCLIFLVLCVFTGFANENTSDPGTVILGHVSDGNEWQLLPLVKPVELHNLNFGLFTIPVTRHVVMLIITSLVLITIMVLAFHKERIVPSKMACGIEPVLFFVRDALVYPSMGKENGEKLLPFFYTLFFFLLASNILGMIPMFSSTMGNLSITLALAIIVFMLVVVLGMKTHGFFGYFHSLIPSGIPKVFTVFFLVLEIISLFIRNGVLAIRLFANMVAGHIIIFALLILMFIVSPMFCVISVPLALFVNLLEVLVAVIQAVVFTLLSAIFIGMSFSKH